MKKMFLFGLLTVGLLAGCHSTASHTAKPSSSATHSSVALTTTSSLSADELKFLREVRSADPAMKHYSDARILRDSQNVCTLLDEGKSVNQLITYEDAHYPAYEAGIVISAGVQGFCPSYYSKLPH